LTFFSAYIDDSGKQELEVVYVGGAVATTASWLVLESAWTEVLEQHGVKAFHASDFNNKLGEFLGWTEERKRALSIPLIKLILDAQCWLFGMGCRTSDFRTVKAEFPNVKANVYELCVELCINRLMDWAKKQGDVQPIQVNVEAGNKHTSFLIRKWLEQLESAEMQQKYKISGINILPKVQHIPFQVADLVAYEHFKIYKQFWFTDNSRIRPSMEALESRILEESSYIEDVKQMRHAFQSIVKLMNRDFS
jgi:hypothetical protein